ncbi:MAG: NAD(+) synthase [Spirochaetes bacterium]|nr:NAD(+) synthase [Spirochaetota bacterium]
MIGKTHELDFAEKAIVLGIRSFMEECGFKKVHLGLSGGLDSAMVAYLAVQAAGKENVVCINMPSRFSSDGSKSDSKELAENLGCRYELISIEPMFESFLVSLEGVFEKLPFDTAEENLQARIRGVLLMAFSNKFNSMLLTGSNKSEIAMGYSTLYGDTCGALSPIGGLFKTEVFALARRINERAAVAGVKAIIPQNIIDKPPSAELRPDQKDTDSLPPYDVLDEILERYLSGNFPEGSAAGRPAGDLEGKIIRAASLAEFKRRQSPPSLVIDFSGLGKGEPSAARAVYGHCRF